ncbi:formylglycine-generating enzyme family protein [Frigidibacter mobilis]|uniref:Sulfatase-modifying factor enzyme-like domain-containing protein n=1 Tax=Frigidibacter mobilis TaxID=1335048 RepID=A0A159Z7N9_9RHOB|nr:SUMF1/EgtB/PvdO family nonheme iron enzyme [Frigidibacter mobilis]AMY70554.1 hypothetical protein AKL17_3322 [Frigidibacter mobilis]
MTLLLRPSLMTLGLTGLIFASGMPLAAQITWDREFYDLGGARFDLPEADLILPLPCNGGAMAFQRITVAVDAGDPLADRRIRLGQSGTQVGYLDYLREEFLRGAFTSPDGSSQYYIARYELTELQYAAISDPDCANQPTPSVRLTVPKLGLSWFEATDIARMYTEWLRTAAPDALPRQNDQPAYLRLPTEPEWEFAARGGEAIDPLDFSAVRPPMEGDLQAYAQFEQTGPTPVGAKGPNPLLLFDMLGNAEELMLEPFRLNAVGHTHGQVGGIVTRGGSYGGTADDMRSSRRSEWPPYNSRTGLAQAQETFGMRLVVAAHVLTDGALVDAVQQSWRARFEGDTMSDAATLPREALQALIDAELDPARKAALEAMQFRLTEAQAAADMATRAQVAATLQMATVMLDNIRLQDGRIDGMTDYLGVLDSQIAGIEANAIGAAAETVAQALAEAKNSRTGFETTIATLTVLRRDLLSSYREALNLLATADSAWFESEFSVLQDKLAQRGNAALAQSARWMRADLGVFRDNPDMDAEILLSLTREISEE